MSNRSIADADEVLYALTSILRREEEVKASEVLRAAELLGKRYGLFGESAGTPMEAPKIVLNIPKRVPRRKEGGGDHPTS